MATKHIKRQARRKLGRHHPVLWQHVSFGWPKSSQTMTSTTHTVWWNVDQNPKNHWQSAYTEPHWQEVQRAVKLNHPNFNTMAAEQTFVWLSRFKKILAAMGKTHHLFYLHRMVKIRNRYTELCYRCGRKPLLPTCKNRNREEQ